VLIIGADDLGASAATTQAIFDAFAAGSVTSTSAMVWMRDSAGAAAAAAERDVPTGLHLNLTRPYDGPGVPAGVRERHAALAGRIEPDGWRDGQLSTEVDLALLRDVVSDQLGEFRRQFGDPTHVDGHHHVHVYPAVSACLPPELPIRSLPRAARDVTAPASARELRLRGRFMVPELTLDLAQVHPELGGAGLQLLRLARSATVEVVTHPVFPEQRRLLAGADWRAALASLEVGSYRELAASRRL
jgi:chitin disaccharide deacetylase